MGRCLQLELSSFPELEGCVCGNYGRDQWGKEHSSSLLLFFSWIPLSVWSPVYAELKKGSLVPQTFKFSWKSFVPKFLVSVSIEMEACSLHGTSWYFVGKDAFSGWLDMPRCLVHLPLTEVIEPRREMSFGKEIPKWNKLVTQSSREKVSKVSILVLPLRFFEEQF